MFLDIGIGIIVALFAGYIFSVKLSLGIILAAVFFTLLPDADFILCLKKYNGENAHKHRDMFHYPLIYLSIGTVLIYILFGKIWSVIFLSSSFLHFLHDSIGMGWGIKWLFPFSKNNIAFFYLYSRKIKNGLRKNIFIFDENNLEKIAKEHGDPEWVKNIYYKRHPIAIIEFAVLIAAVIFLLISLQK